MKVNDTIWRCNNNNNHLIILANSERVPLTRVIMISHFYSRIFLSAFLQPSDCGCSSIVDAPDEFLNLLTEYDASFEAQW
jgi:hypothetical protein